MSGKATAEWFVVWMLVLTFACALLQLAGLAYD